MLTPAQKKIRQELEELQMNGLLYQKHENSLPAKKKRPKNWPFYLFGILLLITIYYTKFASEQNESINSYLTKVQAYKAQSDELLMGFIRQHGTKEEIQQALTKQNQLLENTIDLKAPENFIQHKQDFIEVMNQRRKVLTSFAATNKGNLIELNVKEELARDSLQRALQKEKIKCRLQEDGTILYWVNSKTYQY